jgi:alpha-2-macroglobulin
MNSRRLIVSLLIYAAVFVGVLGFSYYRVRALAAGETQEFFPEQDYYERKADAAPPKPFFSLQTNRIYGTNERPRVFVNYHDLDTLDFFVYRIDDPAQFFKQLDNPHQVGEDEDYSFQDYYQKRKPTFLEKLRRFKQGFYNWFRNYARTQLRHSARHTFNRRFREDAGEDPSTRTPLNQSDYARLPILNKDHVVSSWREKLPPLATEEQQYDRRPISLGKQGAGVYVIEAVNGDLHAYGVAVVSDLVLVDKNSRDGQMLVYAADRQSGAPRAGVNIEIVKGKDQLTTGTTDNQGLLRMKLEDKTKEAATATDEGDGGDAVTSDEGGGEETQASYLVMARERENFAISDIDSFYFDTGGAGDSNDESLKSFIYTDRPVYRPQQKVYFKGILRRLTEKGYVTVGSTVNVTIEDGDGNQVYEKDLPLSSRGTFSGDLDIGEDAPLGSYNITAHVGEATASGYFEVLEYKKPEYKVSVATAQKFVAAGQTARFTVSARYFFGAPVTRADVKYYIYRERYYNYFFDSEADPIEDFGVEGEQHEEDTSNDYSSYGDSMVKEGDGKIDASGNFVVDFAVPQPEAKEEWDYTYRLEAQVTDAARREMQGSASFVATRGSIAAEADPDRYVYRQGETVHIKVKTADYEKHPQAAHVTLKFYEQTWEKVEKVEDGETYTTYQTKERELSSAAVDTNAQGEAAYDYQAQEIGDIAIKAIINEQGRDVSFDGGYFWVADPNNAWSDVSYQEEEQIKLVPDKKSYKPGETAHVLALLPSDHAHLLVTTELSSVMSVRQLDVSGRAATIDVPIEARYAPNVFLNVTYVKNGEMYSNEESLVVPPRDRLLKLEIMSDKKEYKPGESASYTVLVRSADNQPVSGAEVSLGIVDESIYSIRGESAGDIRQEFYGRRYNQVSTSYTSYFNFTGYAGSKPIKLAQNKRAYQLADFKNDDRVVEPRIRKIFKDTAYWQPTLVTGADGKAAIKFPLPDNLTTWRATARAITPDTRVGATTQKVLERKDVIMRLAMPRFLTAGDTVTISGIVHNYLPADKQTQISLEVGGAKLLDAPNQSVLIPKNGEYRANWRVQASQTGQLTLLGKALTDTDSDALELQMDIVPRGVRQTRGEATTLGGDEEDRTVTVNLPGNADPRGRTLRIEVAPSVAATLFGALDYLTSYPYGCTEQTMSSFLPNVIVANALQEVQTTNINEKNNLNKKVRVGLKRLYNFQHDDGGWGWWKDDPTDPWMTAYVVDGLTMASRAGYQVDDQRVEKGRGKLGGLVDSGKNDDGKAIDTETRAYMVYALSMSGGVDPRYVDEMYTNRGRLQPYGRALLALTLKQRGDRRAQQVASEIEGSARATDFDAHWESKRQPALDFSEDDSLEATAVSLKALAQINPQSGVLAKAARWLVANRKYGAYWISTKQTAFAIYGLTDYLKASQELTPNYSVEVYVNNEQVLTRQITSADVGNTQLVIRKKDEEVSNNNQIRIVKHGPGVVYLSTTLNFATTDETAPAQGGGMKITREYLRLVVDDNNGNPVWRAEALSGDLHSGDMIISKLHIEGPHASYVMIEDPIPAGCEQIEQVSGINFNYSTKDWSDWYSAREFRDNRTALFLNYFDGDTTLRYALRVQEPGDFRVAPARVELMYVPTVQANTASTALKILDRQ